MKTTPKIKFPTAQVIALFIATATAIQLHAFDKVYTPPMRLTDGDSILHEIPAYANRMNINYRIGTRKIKESADKTEGWTIVWAYNSPLDYYGADISLGNTAFGSVADERFVQVDIYRNINGVHETIHSDRFFKDVSTGKGFNSLDIELWQRRLYIRIGNGNTYRPVTDFAYESPERPTSCGIIAHRDIEILRQRISTTAAESEIISNYDRTQLDVRFASAEVQPVEGYWYFYDRNMPTMKAKLGGYYTIAIVRSKDTSDAYDILYVAGAQTSADQWQPMRIKGRIIHSGFVNEYDLLWYDSDGMTVGKENSASLENDSSTLVLNFPALETQLRFRRTANRLLEDTVPE